MKKIIATLTVFVMTWLGLAGFLRGGRDLIVRVSASDFLGQALVYRATASLVLAENSQTYYLRADAPAPPELQARAYIVADLITGDVLLQKFPDKSYPIASVSKLTTALTALDMHLTETELLYPLLLESNNEKAEEIAKILNRKKFMQAMNEYVKNINMFNTHYSDPSGISPRNVSSARDLLLLTQHIYKNHPELFSLTLLPQKGLWSSNNLFVQKRHPNYLGGKSGYTPEAKGTLVSVFALPLAGNEIRPVAIILLGTDSKLGVKYEVAQSIIDYIVANVYFK
ncbi:MAG TPA: hypothetical protein VJK09_01685 [Candidatus Paceibacterota bacterium]